MSHPPSTEPSSLNTEEQHQLQAARATAFVVAVEARRTVTTLLDAAHISLSGYRSAGNVTTGFTGTRMPHMKSDGFSPSIEAAVVGWLAIHNLGGLKVDTTKSHA